MQTTVRLQREDFDATAEQAALTRGRTDIGAVVTYCGLTLLWISAIVTLYTGYDYFRAGVRHLIEE